MSELINHPRHYTSHPSSVEAIEICEHLDFCLGNAVKYLFRAGLKGHALQDLQKAAWYLRRARDNEQLKPCDVRGLASIQKVLAHETQDSVLGYVLIAMCMTSAPTDYLERSIARVEREIERTQEKQ